MFRPSCVVVVLLATIQLLSAQVPPRPSPAAVAPAGAAALPPPSNAPAPAGAPDTVTLQYPNSDVGDVLRLYENLTGKKLVMDNTVQGKVNMFIARPIPRDEAIRIVEMNLLMNGFSLVPAGGDVVKVIGAGKSPRTAGVPIISDEDLIPPGDQVISFLFKLRFADPLELQQVLQQYLSPPQAYTSFLALPKSSAVLVTENSAVIRGLVNIINQVDVPPAEVVSEFIKLERADATKVVDMLKEVFEKGGQPTQPGVPGAPPNAGVRNVRPGVPPPPQGGNDDLAGLTALTEDSIVVGKIKISADVRTNRIHVITRPVNMRFVKKLIAEFDANVEFAKPVTRALRYISAADVLPVLVQALTEPGSNQAGGVPEGGATNPNPGSQQQQALQRRPSASSSTGGDFGGGSGGGGGLNVAEELSTQAVDTTPKAVTIGNAKIIADQRSNSIIVLGNREVVVKVQKILNEMDVSSPQVALSTVIGELTLDNNEEFGVDYFQRFKKIGNNQANGTLPTGGVGGISRNGSSTFDALRGFIPFAAAAAATGATGGASVFINAGWGLTAIVHALDATGRFKTISRPTVFTSNNKKAIIASGQEIPIPVNTVSQPTTVLGGTNFANSSSIQFKKVALQLEVVPLINSEREVSLDILQKLDSVVAKTPVNGNDIPIIGTRYIKTSVTSPNCATIVLGGLITNDENRNASGIPILSKIPVVGGLFRTTSKSKTRRELIILMRPEVTLTKLDLQRLRSKHEQKTHIGPEIDEEDCPDCPKPDVTDPKDMPLTPPDLPPVNGDR